MGVLSLVRTDASIKPTNRLTDPLIGPQFPKLHMYTPFVHDGATFGGFHPTLVASSAVANLHGGAVLCCVLLGLLPVLLKSV